MPACEMPVRGCPLMSLPFLSRGLCSSAVVSVVVLTCWEATGAGWGSPLSQGAEHRPPPHLAFGTRLLSASSLSSGKFGAVCTCTEKATGLKLAAKVIKKQTPKDKVVPAGCGEEEGEGMLGAGASHLPPPTHLHQGPGVQSLMLQRHHTDQQIDRWTVLPQGPDATDHKLDPTVGEFILGTSSSSPLVPVSKC